MDNFGLKQRYSDILISIFSQHENVNKVIIYGSRAKGTHHDRSDVDLVIAESDLDRHSLGKLLFEINESDFPYTVDLQLLESIKNSDLKDHIKRVGKVLFERDKQPFNRLYRM